MTKTMLRAKLHRVRVTEADLHMRAPAESMNRCWSPQVSASIRFTSDTLYAATPASIS
jgi:hypothetical protein